VVPIVPAAAVFDLGRGGDASARPDAELGAAAARAALDGLDDLDGLERGLAGAGTGAVCAGGSLKGGVGTASIGLPALGVMVGAVAVVNAVGSPADPLTAALYGSAFVPPGLPRPGTPTAHDAHAWQEHLAAAAAGRSATSRIPPGTATTLAVIATDAALDPARARRMATSGHAGLARALDPVHTLLDGDTVFALATGAVEIPPDPLLALHLHAAAATAVMLAVMDGVLSATATRTPALDVPAYLDVCPSAAPPGLTL
jgi:putative pantetheine hydrolase